MLSLMIGLLRGNRMKTVKAYLSHPIRGLKGANATKLDMEINNYKAIFLANILRTAFPCLELHVPAEMEEFVDRAYDLKIIDEKGILAVDCEIVKDSDFVIFYNHCYSLSNGMNVELKCAEENDIPFTMVYSLSDHALNAVETAINNALKRKYKDA